MVESGLPKQLWLYSVQTAAAVRNKGFNRRTGQAPYQQVRRLIRQLQTGKR